MLIELQLHLAGNLHYPSNCEAMYGFTLELIRVALPERALLAELGQTTPECHRPPV